MKYLVLLFVATLTFISLVLWLDVIFNKDDDFLEVEERHNFQSKMGKK